MKVNEVLSKIQKNHQNGSDGTVIKINYLVNGRGYIDMITGEVIGYLIDYSSKYYSDKLVKTDVDDAVDSPFARAELESIQFNIAENYDRKIYAGLFLSIDLIISEEEYNKIYIGILNSVINKYKKKIVELQTAKQQGVTEKVVDGSNE